MFSPREHEASGETHDEETALVINILLLVVDALLLVGDVLLLVVDVLLQQSLPQTLDIVQINGLIPKPDTPLSHPEYLRSDPQVYLHSRHS